MKAMRMRLRIQVLALCLLLPAHAMAQPAEIEAFADREIVPEGGTANILIRGSSISAPVRIDLEVSPNLKGGRAELSDMSIMLTPTMPEHTTAEETVRVSVRQNKARQKEDETFSIMLSSGNQVQISSPTLSFTVPPNDLSVPFINPPAEFKTIDGVSRLSTVHGTVSIEDLGGRKSFIVSSADVRVAAVSRINDQNSGIITLGRSGMNSFDVVLSIAGNEALSMEDAASLVRIHHLDALDPSARMSAQISAGENHACAVRTDNRLRCWGFNSGLPEDVGSVKGPNDDTGTFLAVSAGDQFTCAVSIDNTLKCWGTRARERNPIDDAPTDGTFLAVSAGAAHACAVRTGGRLWCWGQDGVFGKTDGRVSGPKSDQGTFLSVSAGHTHTCAVRIDRTLRCWGTNESANIDMLTNQGTVPSNLKEETFLSVSAGTAHNCGIKTSGRLECWEFNQGGDSGSVKGANADPGTFLAVSSGRGHTCGIRENGTLKLKCWGINNNPNDGPIGIHGGPVEGPNADSDAFLAVSAGDNFTCAVTAGGEPKCWGENNRSQSTPESAPGGTPRIRISPDTRWLLEKTRVLGEPEDLRIRIRVYLEGALR